MIGEEKPHEIMIKGFRRASDLYRRGLPLDKLKELHDIYEESGYRLTSTGMKLAIYRLEKREEQNICKP